MKRIAMLSQDSHDAAPQEVHLDSEDTVQVQGHLADVYAAALQKVYAKDADTPATEADLNLSGSAPGSAVLQFANAAAQVLRNQSSDDTPIENIVIIGGDPSESEESIEVAASATQNDPETTLYFVNEEGPQEVQSSLESLSVVLNKLGFKVIKF